MKTSYPIVYFDLTTSAPFGIGTRFPQQLYGDYLTLRPGDKIWVNDLSESIPLIPCIVVERHEDWVLLEQVIPFPE